MRLSGLKALAIILLAALVSVPAWGSSTALPGTLNYVEGQASFGNQVLDSHSVGSAHLQAGQTFETQDGRVEVLLTPGIFFRLDSNSSAKMVSPSLSDTEVGLKMGRATVEVAEIHKENNVSVVAAGTPAQLVKTGLYAFDSDQGMLRVFDGKAIVRRSGADIDVKGGREVSLNSDDLPKTRGFDKQAAQDQLYRWSKLRSSYLAEANNDAARIYTGNSWYGGGWYWDPWVGTYKFISTNGIFFRPVGWGFYSPAFVFPGPVFLCPAFPS